MEPRTKDVRPGVSGPASVNSVRDLLGGSSERVTPEVAAEQAATRIIQAVRKRENDSSKVDENV